MRERVSSVAFSTLPDEECVAACIAASAVRDRDAVLGLILSAAHLRLVLPHADKIAVSDGEWAGLFGKKSVESRVRPLVALDENKDMIRFNDELSAALKCSLAETRIRERWRSTLTRTAAYVGLHAEEAESRVEAVLDGIVGADSRRVDDVRSRIEDCGANELLLSRAVLALAAAVVSVR